MISFAVIVFGAASRVRTGDILVIGNEQNILIKIHCMLNCKFCSKYFPIKWPNQKYCSLSCSNSDRANTISLAKRNEQVYLIHPKLCVLCGNIIPYIKRAQTFCSTSCSAKFNNAPRKKNKPRKPKSPAFKSTRICLECSKVFPITAYSKKEYFVLVNVQI